MKNLNTIITIGRQFGSGGKEIGTRLAEDLGVKLYDKEMLDIAAKESGICQDFGFVCFLRVGCFFRNAIICLTKSCTSSNSSRRFQSSHEIILS